MKLGCCVRDRLRSLASILSGVVVGASMLARKSADECGNVVEFNLGQVTIIVDARRGSVKIVHLIQKIGRFNSEDFNGRLIRFQPEKPVDDRLRAKTKRTRTRESPFVNNLFCYCYKNTTKT